MSNFKSRFSNKYAKVSLKDLKFAEDATTKGVVVGCKSCKTPLWKIVITNAAEKKAETLNFPGTPTYESVWSKENMQDITKLPQCWHCGKSWIDAITGPGGTLFPKPYII